MSYNELGQLTSKTRSKGYESQLFQYNIRGWLTRLGCEVFNEDLYYEKTSTGGQGCYNGNISQSRMEWMVGDLSSDNWYMTEEYDYQSLLLNHTYDQLSRLTNTTSTDGFSKFGEAMTYDKHGNIRTINRGGIYQHGWNYIYPNHTYGVIDNVTLSYEGNQLNNAVDLANDPLYLGSQDFKNRQSTYPGTEYHYDANGNLLDDANKGIVTIRSNWLNLPDTVQMENGDMASFSYSPSGDKFMSIYSTANTSTVTMPLGTTLSNGRPAGITVAQSTTMMYMDNVVYEGNPWSTTLHNLSKVLTDDGILVRTNSVTESTPVFERNYYVRDHLGNVRVVFDSQGRVRQLNNYTPFGMEYGESAGNQASVGYQDYKFGGKELDRRFELNWYNFGARSYDLALGRWTSMDPLAEKYYSVSPYVYCANNPMNFLDLHGDSVKVTIDILNDIYNALDENTNVTFQIENGYIKPESFKEQAENSNDIFLKDLYEVASSEHQVNISASPIAIYKDNSGFLNSINFATPYDYNTGWIREEDLFRRRNNYPTGKSINGNFGVTLFPTGVSKSGLNSTNKVIQVIINGKGSLNHRSVGIAHELGHVVLYLRNLPFSHGEKGVDPFIDKRTTIIKKRLGYDF